MKPRFSILALTIGLMPLFQSDGQEITPEALNSFLGSRIETFSILGSSRATNGGIYKNKGNTDAELSLTRLSPQWESSKNRDLGLWGLSYSPIVRGALAWGGAERDLNSNGHSMRSGRPV